MFTSSNNVLFPKRTVTPVAVSIFLPPFSLHYLLYTKIVVISIVFFIKNREYIKYILYFVNNNLIAHNPEIPTKT